MVMPWGGAGLALQSGAVSKGRGQLSAALSSLPSVVTGARDLNTDFGCSRATDQTYPLAAAQAWLPPWPWVAVQASWICNAPSEAQPSDSNLALGGGPGP